VVAEILAEDDLDHAVEQVVLVDDVLVQGHGHSAELLSEAAHAQGLDAVGVGVRDRTVQDPVAAQCEAACWRVVACSAFPPPESGR
jgi:adenine/guanine phosphoribosyltransferase-like PRPP-binding protein